MLHYVFVHWRATLVYRDQEGRDLREYHVGVYKTPATMGYRLNQPERPSEQERARTPLPDSPTDPFEPAPEDGPPEMVPEDGPVDQQEPAVSEGGAGDPAVTPTTISEDGACVGLPQLEKEVPMISFGNQSKSLCRKM